MSATRRLVPALAVILLCVLFLRASIPQVPTGTWESGNPLSVARTGASASLMPDGRVLIAGGKDADGNALASAELFNADGTISAAPPMSTARYGHSAIMLMHGYVLVAGGHTTAGGVTNTAELFDPLTNTWQSVPGTMTDARADFTLSQLQDGDVLVVGGDNGSSPVSSFEKFSLTANAFQYVGTLSSARKSHAAAALNDGRVIITGGSGVDSNGSAIALTSSEIYDPTSNAITPGPSLNVARFAHTATTLIDGTVLIAGGNDGTNDLASAEIYDPVIGTITTSASSLATPRSHHTALLLPNNNSVLIASGTSAGADLASTELYQSWNHAFIANAPMSTPRLDAISSSLQTDGVALVAGGSNQSSTEMYGFATVKTDWPDYSPGQTVTITGFGWRPGEMVTISLAESPAVDTHTPMIAIADVTGSILAEFVPDEGDLGIRFYMKAEGAQSGIQAFNTFKDNRTVTSASLTYNSTTIDTLNPPTGAVSVPFGASISATVRVTTDNGNGNSNWRSTGWRISTSAPGTVTCVNHVDHDGIGSYSESFTITAPSVTATNNVYFIAYSNDTCTNQPSATFIWSGAVITGAATSTSVTNQTAAFSSSIQTVTLTAGVTGATTVNSGTVTFTVRDSGNTIIGAPVTSGAVSAGSASVNFSVPASTPVGTYSISAAYGGATGLAPSSGSGTLTIGKANQTISFSALAGKTYGDADFAVSATATSGLSVSLASQTTPICTVSGTTVHIVAAGTCTIRASQPGDSNWNAAAFVDQTFVVAPKALTVTGLTASNKTYDASTSATLTGTASLPPAEPLATGTTSDGKPYVGDAVSITGTPVGAFSSLNASTAVNVSVTGLTLTGAKSGNYSLTAPTLSADITQKALTVTGLTANDKIYDATTAATLTGTASLLTAEAPGSGNGSDGKPYSGDVVSISGTPTGSFASKSASNSVSVTVIGLALGGGQATNYALTSPTLSAKISVKALTVTGLTATDKIYDATTTATLNGTAALLSAESAGSGTTSDGKPYSSDTVSLTGTPTGTFADKNVNASIAVSVSGLAISGGDATNYSLTAPSLSAVITPKALTYTGLSVPSSRVYDGTTTAVVSGSATLQPPSSPGAGTALDGKPYSGDVVSLTGIPSATYDSKDVVSATKVTFGNLSLSGAQNGNYSLTPSTQAATITPKALTYSGVTVPASKVYDGSTTAVVSGSAVLQATEAAGTGTTSDGKPYNVDSVTLTGTPTGTYNSKDVLTAATVTFGGVSLTGSGATNYSLTALTQSAVITPKDLTITGVVANNKTYDGSPVATLNLVGAALVGVISPDNVTLNSAGVSASFADKNAGMSKPVTVTGFVLSGADLANYQVSQPTGIAANIDPRLLTVSATASDKVYDGTTNASVSLTDDRLGSDAITVSYFSATFADKNAGIGKTVTVAGLNISSGADAGNYTLGATTTVTTTATISPKPVTAAITAADKTYDGTTAATITNCSISGKIGMDDVACSATGAHFASANADPNPQTVTATVALTGTAMGNYTLGANTTATTTARINKAVATIQVTGFTGTYDATAHGATGTAKGVLNEDLSSLLSLGGNFTDVPGGTAHWTFAGNTNYEPAAGDVAIVINKADAIVSVSGYTGIYDAASHGATGSATGVGGANLSAGLSLGATFIDVPGGTAHWTFTGGTNYNDQSGSVAIVINKADAVVSVSGYTGVYDGAAHGATGSATGVGGASLPGLDLGATFTNVPGGTAHWTFAGGTNYNDQSGDVAIVIGKANANVTVTGYTGVYDGAAHGATGSATGIGGASLPGLDLGATFTNVPGGTAHWTFAGGTNYNDQSGDVAIVISKAAATVHVTGFSGTYDGDAHGATGTARGVLDENFDSLLHISGSFTNVPGGTATWVFDGNANYDSATGLATVTITRANATINVIGYSGAYDGAPHGATGTATGVKGENLGALLNLGSSFTNVPGGTAHWTFAGDTNYNPASGDAPITISQATPQITWANPASIVYGTALGGAQLNATANVPGAFNYNPSAGTVLGVGTRTLNVTFSPTDNVNYTTATKSVSIVVTAWTLSGFYQPVSMSNGVTVWNTIKGGQTVPIKFNIYAGSVEKKDVSAIPLGSITVSSVPCVTGGVEDPVDVTNAGGTSLRYDGTQFIQNWQTPKGAGMCYIVRMTAADNSKLEAYFKAK